LSPPSPRLGEVADARAREAALESQTRKLTASLQSDLAAARAREETLVAETRAAVATAHAESSEARENADAARREIERLCAAAGEQSDESARREEALELERGKWRETQREWKTQFASMAGQLGEYEARFRAKVDDMARAREAVEAQREALAARNEELAKQLRSVTAKSGHIEELLRHEVNALNGRLSRQSAEHDETVSRLLDSTQRETRLAAHAHQGSAGAGAGANATTPSIGSAYPADIADCVASLVVDSLVTKLELESLVSLQSKEDLHVTSMLNTLRTPGKRRR
jgi:DNA repair exonuclease SbcCD ATPase subunit